MRDPAAAPFGRQPRRFGRTEAKPREVPREPTGAPFARFLERDKFRQKRDRRRRLTLIVSLGVHVVVLLAVLGFSVFQVEELFSPSVGVKLIPTRKLPPGVVTPMPKPAPPEQP